MSEQIENTVSEEMNEASVVEEAINEDVDTDLQVETPVDAAGTNEVDADNQNVEDNDEQQAAGEESVEDDNQAEEELPLPDNIAQILEAAIFAAGEPLPISKLTQLFPRSERPSKKQLRDVLKAVAETYQDRGVELVEVGNGFRFQARADHAAYLQRLWEKKPPRYSRALLETLSLIVYRQPITRGEIEDVRGVAVSTNITKTLLEHGWIKMIGHKDVPGKPALWGTTKQFLDYFNLKSLSELPPLEDLVDLDELERKLGMQLKFEEVNAGEVEASDGETDPSAEVVEGEVELDAIESKEIDAEILERDVDDEVAIETTEAVSETVIEDGIEPDAVELDLAIAEDLIEEPIYETDASENQVMDADDTPVVREEDEVVA